VLVTQNATVYPVIQMQKTAYLCEYILAQQTHFFLTITGNDLQPVITGKNFFLIKQS